MSDFMSDFLLKIELFTFYFLIFSLIFSEASGESIQPQLTIEPESELDHSPSHSDAATVAKDWEEEINQDYWATNTNVQIVNENPQTADSDHLTGDELKKFSKPKLQEFARGLSGGRAIQKASGLRKDALIAAILDKKPTRTELTALTI
jgi:hypothetical protein